MAYNTVSNMENDIPTPTARAITRRGLLMGLGAAALAAPLAACDDSDISESARTLKSLGIPKGPALVYLSIDGCTSNGPHDLANLKSIVRTMNLPTYMIDIGGMPYRGPYTIKNTAGEAYPGTYVHGTENSIETARKIGFVVLESNLFNHDGAVLLVDEKLNTIAKRQSKLSPSKTIDIFKEALKSARATGQGI